MPPKHLIFILLLTSLGVYATQPCSGTVVFNTTSGSFGSGQTTRNIYPDLVTCSWLIKPECTGYVAIEFTNIAIECMYDYVYIYDGPSISSPLLRIVTGYNSPQLIVTTGSVALVVFKSDTYTAYWGFSANFSMVDCPMGCSGLGNCVNGTCKCPPGYTGVACNETDYSSLELLNGVPAMNTWHSLPTSPPSRAAAALVTIGDSIILFGGYNGANLNDMWTYSVTEDQWNQVPVSGSWPSARNYMGVAVEEDKFTIYGGTASGAALYPFDPSATYLGDMWTYSVNTSTKWTLNSNGQGPGSRDGTACVYWNGDFYLFSGYRPGIFVNDMWKFSGGVWTQLSTTGPSARLSRSAVVHDGRMWIFGGSDVSYNGLDDLWSWSFQSSSWTLHTPTGLKPPRSHEYSLVSLNNVIVMVGGAGLSQAKGSACTPSFSDMWTFNRGVWMHLESPTALSAPLPRRNVMATAKVENSTSVVTQTLYVFGGEAGIYYDDFWKYDASTFVDCDVYSNVTCDACQMSGSCGWYDETKQCMRGSASGPEWQPESSQWFWTQCPVDCSQFNECSECSKWSSCGWCRSVVGTQQCVRGDAAGPINGTHCDQWNHMSCPTSCSSIRQCVACLNQPVCGYCDRALPYQRCVDGGPQGPWSQSDTCNATMDYHFNAGTCLPHCYTHENCSSCVGDSRCGWCLKSQRCLEGSDSGPDYPTFDACDAGWTYDKCPDCSGLTQCQACIAADECGWCESPTRVGCVEGSAAVGAYHDYCTLFEPDACAISTSLNSVIPNQILTPNATQLYHVSLPPPAVSMAGVALIIRPMSVDGVKNVTVYYSQTCNKPNAANNDGDYVLYPAMGEDSEIPIWLNTVASGLFITMDMSGATGVSSSLSFTLAPTIIEYCLTNDEWVQTTVSASYQSFFRVVVPSTASSLQLTTSNAVNIYATKGNHLPEKHHSDWSFSGKHGVIDSASLAGASVVLIGVESPVSTSMNFKAFLSTPLDLFDPKKVMVLSNHIKKGESAYYSTYFTNSSYYLNFTVASLYGSIRVFASTKDKHPYSNPYAFQWAAKQEMVIWDRSVGFKENTMYYIAVYGVESTSFVLFASMPAVADYGWFLENMSNIVLGAIIVLVCMNFCAFATHRIRIRYFNNVEERPRGVPSRVLRGLSKVQLPDDGNWTCAVCLESEVEGVSSLIQLPCGHMYHSGCIKPWLKRNRLCPLCKIDVVTGKPVSEPIPGQARRQSQDVELAVLSRTQSVDSEGGESREWDGENDRPLL